MLVTFSSAYITPTPPPPPQEKNACILLCKYDNIKIFIRAYKIADTQNFFLHYTQ